MHRLPAVAAEHVAFVEKSGIRSVLREKRAAAEGFHNHGVCSRPKLPMFFSEETNQKDFYSCAARTVGAVAGMLTQLQIELGGCCADHHLRKAPENLSRIRKTLLQSIDLLNFLMA